MTQIFTTPPPPTPPLFFFHQQFCCEKYFEENTQKFTNYDQCPTKKTKTTNSEMLIKCFYLIFYKIT